MRTVIFCSGSFFPLSVVAGSIYLKNIPSSYFRSFWKTDCGRIMLNKKLDRGHFLGKTPEGVRVLAFSTPTAGLVLSNLVNTFLASSGIDKNTYRVVEVRTPGSAILALGWLLLTAFPIRRAGKALIDSYLERIYPILAQTVNLDGNFQISDN